MISPPLRPRELIFDAVAINPTMPGRGTNARGHGGGILIRRLNAHRSVALPTRVGWEM